MRSHQAASAATSLPLPLHGVLLPRGSAEGLGHQLWPRPLEVTRSRRCRSGSGGSRGSGEGLRPAALPGAQWGWGGHSWQLPAPVDFPGRVAIAPDPRLVPHGDNGDSPSTARPRQLPEAGWVTEGRCGGAAPLYRGGEEGALTKPLPPCHSLSFFPMGNGGRIACPPLPTRAPPPLTHILGNLRPPAPLPRLGLIQPSRSISRG